VEADGKVNALRFITKNILTVVSERDTTIDWLSIIWWRLWAAGASQAR